LVQTERRKEIRKSDARFFNALIYMSVLLCDMTRSMRECTAMVPLSALMFDRRASPGGQQGAAVLADVSAVSAVSDVSDVSGGPTRRRRNDAAETVQCG
jgi:hypothetical protein